MPLELMPSGPPDRRPPLQRLYETLKQAEADVLQALHGVDPELRDATLLDETVENALSALSAAQAIVLQAAELTNHLQWRPAPEPEA